MMTPRMLRFLKNDGIDLEKTEKACREMFAILESHDFNLKETYFLLFSMNSILGAMTKGDPLRKVGAFDYSSSIKETLSLDANCMPF